MTVLQLRELVSLMEEQLGLPPGWLLAAPCTVLVYVCAKSRIILGAIFTERITEAWSASTTEASAAAAAAEEEDARQGVPSPPRDVHARGIVLADKTSVEKAQCGVRMMWTSPLARRKGVASQLLDCARSQLARGYVLPRDKLAFSQPTPEGTAFIQAYTGSTRFLVYGGGSA